MVEIFKYEFDLAPLEKRIHYFEKPFDVNPNFAIVGVAWIRSIDKFKFEIENVLDDTQKLTVYVSEMSFSRFEFDESDLKV